MKITPSAPLAGRKARLALVFAALAAAFSTIACGLLPAWRLSKAEVQESLKAGASHHTAASGKLRMREVLVGLEVALGTVLLVVGGLLMVSFFRLIHVNKGFQTDHIITQDVSYLSPKYAHGARQQAVEQTTPRSTPVTRAFVATAVGGMKPQPAVKTAQHFVNGSDTPAGVGFVKERRGQHTG